MDPLLGLADRRRWQVLAAAAGLVGVTVSVLSHALLAVRWTDAVLFGVPLGLAAAPMSLSAWYLSRALPLNRAPVGRVVAAALTAATIVASLWAAVGWLWWRLLQAG